MQDRTKIIIIDAILAFLFLSSLVSLIVTSVVIYNNQVHRSNEAQCLVTGCRFNYTNCDQSTCNTNGQCIRYTETCFLTDIDVVLIVDSVNYTKSFQQTLFTDICPVSQITCYYDDRDPNYISLYTVSPVLRNAVLGVLLVTTFMTGGAFAAFSYRFKDVFKNEQNAVMTL